MKKIWNFIKRNFIKNKIKYPYKNNFSEWIFIELEILYFINIQRLKAGVSTVEPDETLRLFAEDRAIYYKRLGYLEEHLGLNITRRKLKDLGLKIILENLYRGSIQAEADIIVKAWMNSPPHKKVILNRNMKYCGVSFANDKKKKYICLLLAK